MKDIKETSKLLAEYLGWVYIPSNDLKGLNKAGWYKVGSGKPKIETATITTSSNINPEKTVEKKEINITPLRYHRKNGWVFSEGNYYKYVCRSHNELRFYNSFDWLFEVVLDLNIEFSVVVDATPRVMHNNVWISEYRRDLGIREQLFYALGDAVKYIKDGKKVSL